MPCKSILTEVLSNTCFDSLKSLQIKHKLLITVINWNNPVDSINCVQSIFASSFKDYYILLVDNGSADNSVKVLHEWLLEQDRETDGAGGDLTYEDGKIVFVGGAVALLANETNLGFAGGNNALFKFGLSIGAPDYFFLLNNDAVLDKECLYNLVKVADERNVSVTGALIKDLTNDNVLFSGADPKLELFFSARADREDTLPTLWGTGRVEGSAMLISVHLINQMLAIYGYVLDPKLFLYCEDSSLCLAAQSMREKILMVKPAFIRHKLAGASGGKNNRLQYYYRTRNRIFLANEWLSFPAKILFHFYYPLSRMGRVLQNLVIGNFHVASAIYKGMIDGYTGRSGKWEGHV